MTPAEVQAPAAAFADENARLAGLAGQEPVETVDGHRQLTQGIWLSTEPGTGPRLSFRPEDGGFRLRLETAGRSRWIALGMALPPPPLAAARWLGLLTRSRSRGFAAWRPALRYGWSEGRFEDVFAAEHVLSADGPREALAHLPVDPARLARAGSVELNLFFTGPDFDIVFQAVELLQIR